MYQKLGSKIEFFAFENPTHKISEQSALKMKENIHFNQYPVLSYALQSGYIWCRIFLLP